MNSSQSSFAKDSDILRVALCQMNSTDDIEKNFQQIQDLVQKAMYGIGLGSLHLFCFPENCLYLRVKEGTSIPEFKISDLVFKKLSLLAQQYKTTFHLGSVPLNIEGKVFNSSVLITENGEIKSTYQKIHLFDIQLTDQSPVRESDAFSFGEKPNIFDLNGWKIGESICYDIRFAELYSYYAKSEVDLILIPSSFLVKTGQAHWHILNRARAIESQCYVLSSAQSGRHQSVSFKDQSRETYGHSLAIDPWGDVLVDIEAVPSVKVIELKKSKINEVRRQIPMKMHRRI